MKVRKTMFLCIAIVLILLLPSGCLLLRVNNSYDKARSFVIENEDELNAVIDELRLQYNDELYENSIFDITSNNLKNNCPVIESFFNEHAIEGYSKISILHNQFIELRLIGATGNAWTYVGLYYSPTGSPYSFFNGHMNEIKTGIWEETVEGSDNSSKSEFICDGWYVYTLYF